MNNRHSYISPVIKIYIPTYNEVMLVGSGDAPEEEVTEFGKYDCYGFENSEEL